MRPTQPTRRDLLTAVATGTFASRLGATPIESGRPLVSIVKIRNGNIDFAVEHAIDLLGGMKTIAQGKERILLKPNLVSPQPNATTKPAVIRALARLMKTAGKDVSIGEGSAVAEPFNARGTEMFRTTRKDLLDGLQQTRPRPTRVHRARPVASPALTEPAHGRHGGREVAWSIRVRQANPPPRPG